MFLFFQYIKACGNNSYPYAAAQFRINPNQRVGGRVQGSATLDFREIREQQRAVRNLVTIGAAINWVVLADLVGL